MMRFFLMHERPRRRASCVVVLAWLLAALLLCCFAKTPPSLTKHLPLMPYYRQRIEPWPQPVFIPRNCWYCDGRRAGRAASVSRRDESLEDYLSLALPGLCAPNCASHPCCLPRALK